MKKALGSALALVLVFVSIARAGFFDETKALAAQGYASAQNNLGFMYSEGNGVTQNFGEAIEWYRRAAEQGSASAQCNLGIKYEKGSGVTQDYSEAVKWYRKAAEQGYTSAQNHLGIMYSQGNGVPQDYVLAHMWFNLAGVSGEVNNRDHAASKMNSAQIEEAQKLAREWKPKK